MASPDIPGSDTATLPASPTNVPRIGDFGHAPGGTRIQDVMGQFTKGGFGFAWEGLDGVIELPDRFAKRVEGAAADVAREMADEMRTYAQDNAPWEDRTGEAREGLKTVVVTRGNVYSIFLGYSVDYGVFLETEDGGKWAIVLPTVERYAGVFAARVRERVMRG